MSLSQNDMGRAFEYSLAMSLSSLLPAPIVENLRSEKAKACFAIASATERHNMNKASKEAVLFLIAHDVRLSESGCSITIQSDQQGMFGDARDIIVHNAKLKQDIGISAKNRHWAVKHPRLSQHIDAHWDWLAPIIARVPTELRDDAFIEYIFKTSGIHFAKHEREKARDGRAKK